MTNINGTLVISLFSKLLYYLSINFSDNMHDVVTSFSIFFFLILYCALKLSFLPYSYNVKYTEKVG